MPRQHGSAKARVVGIGVFDNVRRSMVSPVDSNVEVPIIDKRNGQIIAVAENSIQIMDLETFETFETSSIDEEIKDKISQGAEVEYWRVMGRIKVVRVKGGQ
ncbi:MAG: translation initiation factor IF-5A [Candidatus Nitrosocaldaceae archaeon]